MSVFHSLYKSFGHAWRGLRLAFQTERSFRIQVAIGLAVLCLSLILPLQDWERVALWLASASVLVLELINSMVERLADLAKPRLDAYVKDIKDLMAAAVFVAVLFSVMIGFIILSPQLSQILTRV